MHPAFSRFILSTCLTLPQLKYSKKKYRTILRRSALDKRKIFFSNFCSTGKKESGLGNFFWCGHKKSDIPFPFLYFPPRKRKEGKNRWKKILSHKSPPGQKRRGQRKGCASSKKRGKGRNPYIWELRDSNFVASLFQ